MNYKITKGKHHFSPVHFRPLLHCSLLIQQIRFDYNCRYDLKSDDQFDINKLFGIGYGFNHHKNSARFGWRYDVASDRIQIFAYCYLNGERKFESIGYVRPGYAYNYKILVEQDGYSFGVSSADRQHNFFFKMKHAAGVKFWGYYLNPYFGGNQPAPHNMQIEMSRV